MKKQPNPYNLFKIRNLSVPGPHLEYINIPLKYNMQTSVEKWIVENLKGRFYIGKAVSVNNDNKVDTTLKIGFEESKELSYFTLACPYLKYH